MSALMGTTGGVTIDNGPTLTGRLEVEQEFITYRSSSATKPDPRWDLVDPSGHFHAYDAEGQTPTLVDRSRHIDCDGTGAHDEDECEGYDVIEQFCRICDVPVEPDRLSDTDEKSMPGLKHWSVTMVGGNRPVEGLVTVRFAAADKVYFGVAHARVESAEGDAFGMRFTTRLTGVGPLGVRP